MSQKIFKQPSVMNAQKHFSQIPSADIPRSRFDRSHAVKTAFDAGDLIPIYLDEVLPGDTFNMTSTSFGRLATPLHPIMDNIYMDVHFFFVPTRLVWDEFQEFMGERKKPTDDPNRLSVPKRRIGARGDSILTVCDYFGLPLKRLAGHAAPLVSVLPLRAYKLIWNEWYRDENLQEPEPLDTSSSGASAADTDILPLKRGKRKDYFTSALPWPQKGDPVEIPLEGTLPVYGRTVDNAFMVDGHPVFSTMTGNYTEEAWWHSAGGVPPALTGNVHLNTHGAIAEARFADTDFNITVNSLRTAFQIQKLLERDARGGTRYIELILSHFGVRSDDARLQRPEYLGGGTSNININPIASTAVVPDEAPQGNLSGVGTTVNKAGFQKSFTEHGYIIGLASARADLTYQQGIDRLWTRTTRYDYYWPSLAHLGEQAILNKELCYTGDQVHDEAVFGYQERYAEYRYKPSIITGIMNSDYPASLDSWHLGQHFVLANPPALNAAFITEAPPIHRTLAVSSEPQFILDVWHDLKCDRPMPVYSVPGLIDHF